MPRSPASRHLALRWRMSLAESRTNSSRGIHTYSLPPRCRAICTTPGSSAKQLKRAVRQLYKASPISFRPWLVPPRSSAEYDRDAFGSPCPMSQPASRRSVASCLLLRRVLTLRESILTRRFATPYEIWKPKCGMPRLRPATELRLSHRRLSCGHVRAPAATAGPAGASAPELPTAELPAPELSTAELSTPELSTAEPSPPELSVPELSRTEPTNSALPVGSRRALSGATAISARPT